MALPLEGRVIALAESRQLKELAALLEREGARTIRCPMLSILDAPDQAPVAAWIGGFVAEPCAYMVFLTGEGVQRLVAAAERVGTSDAFVAELAKSRLVTRGPKPVRALKELGLAPAVIAAMPTMDGVIDSLRQESLRGTSVGVQLYPEAASRLEDYLESVGATVRPVWPYVYAPQSDSDHVAELIHELANGNVAVIVFTSSPQVDRLSEVARERSLGTLLEEGWSKTKVAAIGPVVAENLRQRGVRVDICPEQGFVMKNLVRHIERALGS